ncbi:A disintegrin and metalloproteinase with thrombospondin motifs adt-1-like [Anneissia japonica]|uniref:A disintegrin and metalloproteinase with thrombospondin motifs adt-1-like n=1 Tax=Anneissia japonica TaxID=1529436 RepID=UPI0014255706|nr:A disintegrin and metalloproteinase with thrombospondin motifs adt-1-like [Anneissia japonica]
MGNKSRKCSAILSVILLLLLSGFVVCGVYHYILFKSTGDQCADQCYNGGSMTQETKTCTCAEGYGGRCCEFKTQTCHTNQWSEWTHCSKKCGPGGIQFRIKNVVCPVCSQKIYEKRACNVYCYNGGIPSNVSDECICERGYGGECCECKIQNCELTSWNEWSTCTHECGPHGMRFRTRNVAKPPACGGDPCPGILTEEEECNRKCENNRTLDYEGYKCTCPVGYNGQCCACKVQDCVMTPWSNWSECSQKCGPRGIAFRTRGVQTAPKCGGTPCSNIFAEEKLCNRMCENEGILDYEAGECKCPDGYSGQYCDCKNVDCELNMWTEWSTCENATARQVRSHDVKRYPNCAGRECEGSLVEDRSCAVALKRKLLLPEWSVIVLSTYGAILTVFIITVVIYVIRSRRREMIPSLFEKNDNDVKDVQQDAVFTNLPPLPEKHDHGG